MIVVRVENLGQRLCQILLLHCLVIIPLVKGIQRKIIDGLRIPDAQRVHKAVAVAHDRHVVGDGLDGAVALLPEHDPSVCRLIGGHVAAEVHLLGVLGPAKLKRVAVLEPVVRNLHLIAVADLLLEHPVAVADAAAVGGIVQGCEGVQETCRKASEAAVAQSRIRLLVLDLVDVKAELCEGLLHRRKGLQVDQVVAEGAAHQELHGEVVQGLRVRLLKCLLGSHPVVDDLILQSIGGCLKHLLLCGLRHLSAVHGADVVLHAPLEEVLVESQLHFFHSSP